MSVPGTAVFRTAAVVAALGLFAGMGTSGCSTESLPPAPYLGDRPLEFLEVTQSFTPDIQWVGGRVAAVGINRGDTAALDSTLVWLRVGSSNSISSVVRLGPEMDDDLVESYGGVPQTLLDDNETYTFWIAQEEALNAGLQAGQFDAAAFADTTVTFNLVLLGRGGGDPNLGVNFRIFRDQEITRDRYVITWTPADVQFRRLALRQATTGGWTNLKWHILVPEDQPPTISPPLTLGVAPEGTIEVVAFPETGFDPAAHILWAVTDDWQESFALRAQGYSYFTIFASNFD